MRFNIFVKKIESENSTILRNFKNNSIVVLTNEETKKVLLFLANQQSQILQNESINFLLKNEFIVKDDCNEGKDYLETLSNDRENDKFMCIHFVPTSRCNFRCPYCYQNGIDRTKDISPEELDKFLTVLENYIISNNIKALNFVLHGGEPTLKWQIVESILPKIKIILDKNSVEFWTQIVTNGYLLDTQKAEFLSKYNLSRIQVTLDGPRLIHDSRRMKIDGSGTFNDIVKNISNILEENLIDKISLRLNIDTNNYDEIKDFISLIPDIFPKDRISLSLGFITNTITETRANYFSKYGISDFELSNKYLELYKIAIQSGFAMPDAYSVSSFCTSKMKHSFILTPGGIIYKCLSMVGRPDYSIGNIYSFDEKKEQKGFERNIYEECLKKKCEYLPLCQCGCKFENFLKNNNQSQTNCRYDLLNIINTGITKIVAGGTKWNLQNK